MRTTKPDGSPCVGLRKQIFRGLIAMIGKRLDVHLTRIRPEAFQIEGSKLHVSDRSPANVPVGLARCRWLEIVQND